MSTGGFLSKAQNISPPGFPIALVAPEGSHVVSWSLGLGLDWKRGDVFPWETPQGPFQGGQ